MRWVDEKEPAGVTSSFEEYKIALSGNDDVDISLTKYLYDKNSHLKLVTGPCIRDEGNEVLLKSVFFPSPEEALTYLKECEYLYMAYRHLIGSHLSTAIVVRCV